MSGPTRRSVLRIRPIAVLIRMVVMLAGVALIVLPEHVYLLPAAVTGFGVLVAATVPAEIGSTFATGAFIVCWIFAAGLDATPGLFRTLLAAVALYLLHQATALAAFVPLGSRVDPAVVRRWGRQCVLPLAIAAAVIVVDEVVPRTRGSAAVVLAGLVGVLLALGVATRVLWIAPSSAKPSE